MTPKDTLETQQEEQEEREERKTLKKNSSAHHLVADPPVWTLDDLERPSLGTRTVELSSSGRTVRCRHCMPTIAWPRCSLMPLRCTSH